MNTSSKNFKGRHSVQFSSRYQAGISLVEMMIALALSVIVTSAMVLLMANSLGTSTRIIHMSQLSDELRNAMSMMTRDLRRANYTANSVFCYGNADCGESGGAAQQLADIQIVGECFVFSLDRDSDGNAADDGVAAFRRVTNGGVGVIEMWTGDPDETPDCDTDPPGTIPWIELTDPRTVNVSVFEVDDAASFSVEFTEDETNTFNNRQRQIDIRLQGELVLEEAAGINMVSRRIEDTIYVRNDFVSL